MLPGLRFLFVAIVLATSLLVFGLGAAALFRAAHEEFASIPARRAPPEPQFAQQQPPETPPVLAMLRVDPSAADKVMAESVAPTAPAISEPTPAVEAAPPPEPDKFAAAKTDDPPSPVAEKPDTQAAEPTPAAAPPVEAAVPAPAAEAAPPQQPASSATEAAPVAPEPRLAAVDDTPIVANEPAVAAPAPAVEPAPATSPSPEAIAAEARIATLGGPEVTVDRPSTATAKVAETRVAGTKKADRTATSKPAHRKARRRIAHAHRARQVAAQQVDPFGQPIPTAQRQ